ncbi:MAG: GSCFA domain-containing protein [Putridiphycobacter sp.]
MKFRTEFNIPKSRHKINHQSKILALGSCFVENIGSTLKDLQFNIQINPFGIIFNPYSIAKILNNALPQKIELQTASPIIKKENNTFINLDFHSKFNASTLQELEDKILLQNRIITDHLSTANYLILTFGTSWVYTYLESNHIVANCHKIPQQQFKKSQLELNNLISIYEALILKINQLNPDLKILLTVSPVRHLKDGFIENNISKSTLILLCQNLKTTFPEVVEYFPSYELQMDDLRDYRFYNSDLLHPNEMAKTYIFEKFAATYFDDNTQLLNRKIQKLNALKKHKFINASKTEIENHQNKILKLEEEISLKC